MFGWMRKFFGPLTVGAYCFKCRCDRTIENPKTIVLSNGTKTRQGVCHACGTNLSKLEGKV
jgi:hypothetical protein